MHLSATDSKGWLRCFMVVRNPNHLSRRMTCTKKKASECECASSNILITILNIRSRLSACAFWVIRIENKPSNNKRRDNKSFVIPETTYIRVTQIKHIDTNHTRCHVNLHQTMFGIFSGFQKGWRYKQRKPM